MTVTVEFTDDEWKRLERILWDGGDRAPDPTAASVLHYAARKDGLAVVGGAYRLALSDVLKHMGAEWAPLQMAAQHGENDAAIVRALWPKSPTWVTK